MRYIDQKSSSHIFMIKLSIVICFAVIASRLFFLQVIKHDHFQSKGERNFIRLHHVPAPRGNIFDQHGTLLVTNQPITHLYWKGSGFSTLTKQQKEIINFIEITLSSEEYAHIIPFGKIKHAEKYGKEVRIGTSLTFDQLSKISEQCSDNQNIIFKTTFERFYPHQTVACHLLGYLNNLQSGKMGLEHLFENKLQGQPGSISYIINSVGKQLSVQDHTPEQSGEDIITTLDLRLQQEAEKLMPPEIAGAFILMDPKTGAIRTLVSRPSFDPTIFLKPLTPEAWDEIQKTKPFLNRAFDACYPPASPFKLVTMSAALETGIIQPEDRCNCRGYTTFRDRKYYCNRRTGHGVLDMKEAIAHSCNIPCFAIAQKMPIDTLARYAEKFGLGTKTNIIFNEKMGVVPSNKWKIKNKGERWWTGETLSASIGQSFLLATPIQMACMISSVFTGYLVTPRIVEQTPVVTRPLEIQKKTIAFLREGMKSVVTTGTGIRIKRIRDITIYAKTGTAQTCSKTDDGKISEDHAWFVAHFQYREHEPLVLVILLEHAGSSSNATRVAEQFLKRYKIVMQ